MNKQIILPAYTTEELANKTLQELTGILIKDEDRLPLNVIVECARRGEPMLDLLIRQHQDNSLWQYERDFDQFWQRFHTVMILGMMPDERAGLLLVELMRRMALEEDHDLQDWLDPDWPGLYRNKPESIRRELCKLCEQRGLDWYLRASAVNVIMELAGEQGGDDLERKLAWLAGMATDENEDFDFRLLLGNYLLDHPRVAYLPLLEDLANRQDSFLKHFSMDDVRRAYAGEEKMPGKEYTKNPWAFYEPDAIIERQLRWQEEAAKASQRQQSMDNNTAYEPFHPDTYIRLEPKIGRNDPCPCGSGKKYKKCCL